MTTALLIVDVQVDFAPGGSLACPGGDQLGPAILTAARKVDFVFASRDWHPADHCSFIEQGGGWPVHCVAGTPGARYHPSIADVAIDYCTYKGMKRDKDQYSAMTPGMANILKEFEVDHLVVCGIATDVCVQATVEDALADGLRVTLLTEGCAGTSPENHAAAIAEMRDRIINSALVIV